MHLLHFCSGENKTELDNDIFLAKSTVIELALAEYWHSFFPELFNFATLTVIELNQNNTEINWAE